MSQREVEHLVVNRSTPLRVLCDRVPGHRCTCLTRHGGKDSAITTHQFQRQSLHGWEPLHSSAIQDSVYHVLVSNTAHRSGGSPPAGRQEDAVRASLRRSGRALQSRPAAASDALHFTVSPCTGLQVPAPQQDRAGRAVARVEWMLAPGRRAGRGNVLPSGIAVDGSPGCTLHSWKEIGRVHGRGLGASVTRIQWPPPNALAGVAGSRLVRLSAHRQQRRKKLNGLGTVRWRGEGSVRLETVEVECVCPSSKAGLNALWPLTGVVGTVR
jgi:hypothetical protein